MAIELLCIGERIPAWAQAGVDEYCKRIQPPYNIHITEFRAATRSKNSTPEQCIEKEGALLMQHLPNQGFCIALDKSGKQHTTEQLADKLHHWIHEHRNLYFIIGGPDGLSQTLLQRVNHTWSLSNLTFPHPLARVIAVEQLYRAWSVLQNHPYHK